jgi:hypothetical protein
VFCFWGFFKKISVKNWNFFLEEFGFCLFFRGTSFFQYQKIEERKKNPDCNAESRRCILESMLDNDISPWTFQSDQQ